MKHLKNFFLSVAVITTNFSQVYAIESSSDFPYKKHSTPILGTSYFPSDIDFRIFGDSLSDQGNAAITKSDDDYCSADDAGKPIYIQKDKLTTAKGEEGTPSPTAPAAQTTINGEKVFGVPWTHYLSKITNKDITFRNDNYLVNLYELILPDSVKEKEDNQITTAYNKFAPQPAVHNYAFVLSNTKSLVPQLLTYYLDRKSISYFDFQQIMLKIQEDNANQTKAAIEKIKYTELHQNSNYDMFIFWAGSNDILTDSFRNKDTENKKKAILKSAKNYKNVLNLAEKGQARNLAIIGIASLNKVPEEKYHTEQQGDDFDSAVELNQYLKSIAYQHSTVYLDVNNILNALYEHPQLFIDSDKKEISKEDIDKFLFSEDGLHPTTESHSIVANILTFNHLSPLSTTRALFKQLHDFYRYDVNHEYVKNEGLFICGSLNPLLFQDAKKSLAEKCSIGIDTPFSLVYSTGLNKTSIVASASINGKSKHFYSLMGKVGLTAYMQKDNFTFYFGGEIGAGAASSKNRFVPLKKDKIVHLSTDTVKNTGLKIKSGMLIEFFDNQKMNSTFDIGFCFIKGFHGAYSSSIVNKDAFTKEEADKLDQLLAIDYKQTGFNEVFLYFKPKFIYKLSANSDLFFEVGIETFTDKNRLESRFFNHGNEFDKAYTTSVKDPAEKSDKSDNNKKIISIMYEPIAQLAYQIKAGYKTTMGDFTINTGIEYENKWKRPELKATIQVSYSLEKYMK